MNKRHPEYFDKILKYLTEAPRTAPFPGKIFPVRDGIYERLPNDGSDWWFFSRWSATERKWYVGSSSALVAAEEVAFAYHQNLPWRGLMEPPPGEKEKEDTRENADRYLWLRDHASHDFLDQLVAEGSSQWNRIIDTKRKP